MSRYHITEKGNPGRCTAKPGNCPLGSEGEHYANPAEARQAYEASHETTLTSLRRDADGETQEAIAFVKATDLRVGDEYEGSPITEKKIGSKWVTLSTEAKPKILVDVNETVAVQRSESTPEAKAAGRKADQEWAAQRSIDQHLGAIDKAQADLNEYMETYGHFRGHHLATLMKAQANRELAERVLSIAENQDLSLSDARERLKEILKENLTSGYSIQTGLSRSTSVVDNAMEDAKTEAMLDFIRNDWW